MPKEEEEEGRGGGEEEEEGGSSQSLLLSSGAAKSSSSGGGGFLYQRAAFFLLGLTNNGAWVILAAGSKLILEGGVGFVYMCETVPGFILSLSSPYWLHLIPYSKRVTICALLMAIALGTVAMGHKSLTLQMIGVALASLQSALGEATFLALSSRFDSDVCLSAWGSGTGFAGIFGYGWVFFFHQILGLGFPTTLLMANILAVLLLGSFQVFLAPELASRGALPGEILHGHDAHQDKLSALGVFQFMMKLWPFMLPLTLVYFSEYAMQAGAWAAIGFPVTSVDARYKFYELSNWAYQFGVFFSRTYGLRLRLNMFLLWVLPAMQASLLVFFCADAVMHFWYNWGLLALCFVAGLLGGSVYVNAFSLISKAVPPNRKEQALSGASSADTLGIIISDFAGLLIQACIYLANDIEGAAVSCSL
jgi:battenin